MGQVQGGTLSYWDASPVGPRELNCEDLRRWEEVPLGQSSPGADLSAASQGSTGLRIALFLLHRSTRWKKEGGFNERVAELTSRHESIHTSKCECALVSVGKRLESLVPVLLLA